MTLDIGAEQVVHTDGKPLSHVETDLGLTRLTTTQGVGKWTPTRPVAPAVGESPRPAARAARTPRQDHQREQYQYPEPASDRVRPAVAGHAGRKIPALCGAASDAPYTVGRGSRRVAGPETVGIARAPSRAINAARDQMVPVAACKVRLAMPTVAHRNGASRMAEARRDGYCDGWLPGLWRPVRP